jgi:hypothetical protein
MPATRRTRTPRDERLVKLPDNYLECRVDRHQLDGEVAYQRWRYRDADTLEKRSTCSRCGTVQIREVVEWGRAGVEAGALYRPTRYDYAAGYLLHLQEGEDRITRYAVRLEDVRRILERMPDIPIIRRGE